MTCVAPRQCGPVACCRLSPCRTFSPDDSLRRSSRRAVRAGLGCPQKGLDAEQNIGATLQDWMTGAIGCCGRSCWKQHQQTGERTGLRSGAGTSQAIRSAYCIHLSFSRSRHRALAEAYARATAVLVNEINACGFQCSPQSQIVRCSH